jgi:exodeoxyribonuclease III
VENTPAMRLATWNINSVRLRLQYVLRVLKEYDLDVLCLQETKTQDSSFPAQEIADAGWAHQAIRGEKSYNGVAILSRIPIDGTEFQDWVGKGDCRHISASINGYQIHNIYLPAGGDIPDRNENVKFGHKLDFVSEVTDYFAKIKPVKSVLVGDLNIAPLAEDVWSTKQLKNVVSHTEIERKNLINMQTAGGWIDSVRRFFGPDEILYSWWSYRARDYLASNRGRRLDHIWISSDLEPQIEKVKIHAETRGWEKPSDHVPISLQLS